MGLFTGLLTLPLAPVRGVAWVGEQVRDLAEQELDERTDAHRRLSEIEAAYEEGQISAQRREELEDRVLEDLLWTEAGDR